MSGHVPSYPKVVAFGSYGTEACLLGPVIVEEKADGSQLGWGLDETGELCIRSHGQQLILDNAGMFQPAVNYLRSLDWRAMTPCADIWFYGEYFQRPKQNTLAYERTPRHGIMLFDCFWQGMFRRDMLREYAEMMDLETAPVLAILETGEFLAVGRVPSLEQDILPLLARESFLGRQQIEGVVIKNYHETISIGGKVQPLFCKVVRPQFTERNISEHKAEGRKNTVEVIIESCRSEARWLKAIQRRREEGALLGAAQDIGPLIRSVQEDLVAEEKETIKAQLWTAVSDEVKRKSVAGLAEWYKERLAKGEIER